MKLRKNCVIAQNQLLKQICQLVENFQGETTTPDVLSHYTSGDGLKGIIENGELWATRIDYTNDPLELKHTYEQFIECVRTSDSVHLNKYGAQLIEATKAGGPNQDRYSTFVVSFSKHEEDLSQFRGYANDGRGYSISFKSSVLLEKINQVLMSRGSEPGVVEWRKVQYNAQALQDLMQAICSSIHEAFEAINSTEDALFRKEARGYGYICTQILAEIAACVKQPGYSMEEEYRLVTKSPSLCQGFLSEKFRSMIEVRFNNDRPIPYIPLPLKHNISGEENSWIEYCGLKALVVGPKLEFQPAEEAIHYFLSNNGDEKRLVEIKKPSTSYR